MKRFWMIMLLLLATACTSIPKEDWKTSEGYKKSNIELLPGDILLNKKSLWRVTRFWGHSAIVMDKEHVAEAYIIFGDVRKIKLDKWLEKGANKNFVVLRLREIDHEFRMQLMKNLETEIGKPYALFTSKMGTRGYYCSQLVWQMYYQTAQDLGREVDLDIDQGFFVFPYDLFNEELLEVIEL